MVNINFDNLIAIIDSYKLYFANWKSHATLTLLANQDCPFWLQYD